MTAARYRVMLLAAILSAFLFGLHAPLLHEIVDHGHRPSWPVLSLTALFALVTVGCGWRLLRKG